MQVVVEVAELPFREPFVSAREVLHARPLVLLALRGSDGIIGRGEAAPLPGYDRVSVEHVLAALEDCRPLLEESDGHELQLLLTACAERAVLPQALAAIDLALWDLAGRRTRQPVWRLLGAERAEPVSVNATIAAEDRATAATQAAAARKEGFSCVKVKVGMADDGGRVAAVRAAAGPQMQIRLDANGVWSVDEAVAALHALEPAGIELCEEPVRGLDAVASVSDQTPVPLALDESGRLPGALDRLVCEAICLKISGSGGISGLLRDGRRARIAGYEPYLASALDGPLGIAAALHAAARLGPERACGLATLRLFAERPDPLPAVAGRIAVPSGPGLGDGLLDWS